MKKGSKALKPYKRGTQPRHYRGNTTPVDLPDTLLDNLMKLDLSTELINEIKQRRKDGQERTQISREMNIQKLYVNRALELIS